MSCERCQPWLANSGAAPAGSLPCRQQRTRCPAEAGRKRSEPVHPAAGAQHAGPGFRDRLGESLKKVFQLGASLLLLLSLADAHQTRVYREGGNWAEEIPGNLAAAKNPRVRVDAGTVRGPRGTQAGID